jgi:hypothetical protein
MDKLTSKSHILQEQKKNSCNLNFGFLRRNEIEVWQLARGITRKFNEKKVTLNPDFRGKL